MAFTTLQTRLLIPINQLLQVSVDVQSSLALFGRIFELLDLRARDRDRAGGAHARPGRPCAASVALERRVVPLRRPSATASRAGTADPPARPWALRDVSLLVAPGQLAALVGPSGAGKTTISLPRPAALRRRREGAVTLDGHDVRELTAGLDRRRGRRGDPGELPVRRHGAREPPLRAARRDRRGGRGGRPGRLHPRPRRSPSTTATTPSSASAATASRAASASGWRSPA